MFYISVSNGLLKDGHRQRMGEAVWEIMWPLDHMTRIDGNGYGWVLVGKPVKLADLATDLAVHRSTEKQSPPDGGSAATASVSERRERTVGPLPRNP